MSKYILVPLNHCVVESKPQFQSHNCKSNSEYSFIAEEHKLMDLDSIRKGNLKLETDASILMQQYPHNRNLISSLYHKMVWFPDFPTNQNSSTLAMREIQSTIVEVVYKLLQQCYPQLRFELYANQSVSNSLNIYLVLGEDKQKIPLLFGEDKANQNDEEICNALECARIETRDIVNHIAQRNPKQVSNYTPIIFITSGFTFSMYFFNKVFEDTGSTFKTLDTECTHVKFSAKDVYTYQLLELSHVYKAIVTVTSILSQSITTVISIWNNLIIIEHSPEKLVVCKQTIVKSFILFGYKHSYNFTVHGISNYSSKKGMKFVKYVCKEEADLYLSAKELSPITIPADVVQFEVQLPYSYALVMNHGIPLSQADLDLSSVHEMFLRTVSAVKSYHKGNLIHRDIKPNNLVLLMNDLYIIDFGLSVQFLKEENNIAYITHSFWKTEEPLHRYAGTKSFMAPEMLEKRPYGTKVDCFGCGMVMLFILSSVKQEQFTKRDEYLDKMRRKQFFCKHSEFSKYEAIIEGLLELNPQHRLSAEQAFSLLHNLDSNIGSSDEHKENVLE